MKIQMPRFFHKLFGEETSRLTLILALASGLIATLLLPLIGQDALTTIPIQFKLWILMITFDVFAGIISNFSVGTKTYYLNHPHPKPCFAIIHIYPIVLALLTPMSFITGLSIYAMILASCVIVQMQKNPIIGWIIAGLFVCMIAIVSLFFIKDIPLYLDLIHIGIAIKLILAFSISYPMLSIKEHAPKERSL